MAWMPLVKECGQWFPLRSHFRRLLGTALASTLIVGGLWGALSAPVSVHAIIDLEGLEYGVHCSNGKCSIATTTLPEVQVKKSS
jgi:hypothetical protein